jgi:hypothetical protein
MADWPKCQMNLFFARFQSEERAPRGNRAGPMSAAAAGPFRHVEITPFAQAKQALAL